MKASRPPRIKDDILQALSVMSRFVVVCAGCRLFRLKKSSKRAAARLSDENPRPSPLIALQKPPTTTTTTTPTPTRRPSKTLPHPHHGSCARQSTPPASSSSVSSSGATCCSPRISEVQQQQQQQWQARQSRASLTGPPTSASSTPLRQGLLASAVCCPGPTGRPLPSKRALIQCATRMATWCRRGSRKRPGSDRGLVMVCARECAKLLTPRSGTRCSSV
ncbi:hypothetical protein BKA81DRAFT_234296 [Phyllosticta paracitricarpa]